MTDYNCCMFFLLKNVYPCCILYTVETKDEIMKKIILIIIAVGMAFAAGYFCPRKKCEKTPENTVKPVVEEVMPATRPLFSAAVCRQSADFLNGRMELAKTPAERNLYAIAAATLREAELFSLFESRLQEMTPQERTGVIAQEAEWQKFYQEEMFRPLRNGDGSAAALESSLRSSSLIFDRILYWASAPEDRASYDELKELPFTDRFSSAPVELSLHQGSAWNGTTRYQLLPGIVCGDAKLGCGMILNGEGNRQLVCWRDGKMVKSVRVPGLMEVISLSFNDDRTAVHAGFMVNGKKSAKPLIVRF